VHDGIVLLVIIGGLLGLAQIAQRTSLRALEKGTGTAEAMTDSMGALDGRRLVFIYDHRIT
jgi:hypothetical protein